MQGAQSLRSEAYLLVRCNDEGETQRRRWTFYEAITNCEVIFLCPTPKGDIPRHAGISGGRMIVWPLPNSPLASNVGNLKCRTAYAPIVAVIRDGRSSKSKRLEEK